MKLVVSYVDYVESDFHGHLTFFCSDNIRASADNSENIVLRFEFRILIDVFHVPLQKKDLPIPHIKTRSNDDLNKLQFQMLPKFYLKHVGNVDVGSSEIIPEIWCASPCVLSSPIF